MTPGANTAIAAATDKLFSLVLGWMVGFALIAVVAIILKGGARTPIGKALVDVGAVVALAIWTLWKIRHMGAS